MSFDADPVIRALTMATLAGLLFSVGLKLTWKDLANAIRSSRLAWLLPLNFVFVPALALLLARVFSLPPGPAAGMMLLAAAPFAPVVPTYTRLARGDLALAAALTGTFPVLCAFITPVVCAIGLRGLGETAVVKLDFLSILLVLVAIITLPLAAGVLWRHLLPASSARLVKPIQIVSEATGAASLVFVTVTQFETIRLIGVPSLVAIFLLSEISFLAGYASSGPAPGARLAVGLGTANRNIALALLVAVDLFPGTPVVAGVAANGLLLILLGLVHVGVWRWRFGFSPRPPKPPQAARAL